MFDYRQGLLLPTFMRDYARPPSLHIHHWYKQDFTGGCYHMAYVRQVCSTCGQLLPSPSSSTTSRIHVDRSFEPQAIRRSMFSNGSFSVLVMIASPLPDYPGQPRDTTVKQSLFVSIDTASRLMPSRSIENYAVGRDPQDLMLGFGGTLK